MKGAKVYGIYSESGRLLYVGVTTQSLAARMAQHAELKQASTAKLLRDHPRASIRLIRVFSKLESACRLESKLIAKNKGSLYNVSKGGDHPCIDKRTGRRHTMPSGWHKRLTSKSGKASEISKRQMEALRAERAIISR